MIKKSWIVFLFTLLLLFAGCGDALEPQVPATCSFSGSILSLDEHGILVEPTPDSWVAASADRVFIGWEEVTIADADGSPLIAENLLTGDTVTICTKDDTIKESCPIMVTAIKIIREAPRAVECVSSIVIPSEEYDTPDFIEKAQFALSHLPDHEGLRPMEYDLYDYGEARGIGRYVADIWYEADISREIHFRVGWEGDVAPLHEYQPAVSAHSFINAFGREVTVTVETSRYNVLALWEDSFSFALWIPNCTPEEALPVIEEFVTQVMVVVT